MCDCLMPVGLAYRGEDRGQNDPRLNPDRIEDHALDCLLRGPPKIAPRGVSMLVARRGDARVEFLATACDLADRFDNIDARMHTLGFAARLFLCIKAVRQLIHAVLERVEALAESVKRFALFAAAVAAVLDPRRHRAERARRAFTGLRDAALEFADSGFEQFLDQLPAISIWLPKGAPRTGFIRQFVAQVDPARRIDLGVFPSRKTIKARTDCLQPFVAVESPLGRLIGNDVVEPFAQRNAGAARCFLGCFARFATHTPNAPRSGSVHDFYRRRRSSNHSASGSIWRCETMFGTHGEHIVKIVLK